MAASTVVAVSSLELPQLLQWTLQVPRVGPPPPPLGTHLKPPQIPQQIPQAQRIPQAQQIPQAQRPLRMRFLPSCPPRVSPRIPPPPSRQHASSLVVRAPRWKPLSPPLCGKRGTASETPPLSTWPLNRNMGVTRGQGGQGLRGARGVGWERVGRSAATRGQRAAGSGQRAAGSEFV